MIRQGIGIFQKELTIPYVILDLSPMDDMDVPYSQSKIELLAAGGDRM